MLRAFFNELNNMQFEKNSFYCTYEYREWFYGQIKVFFCIEVMHKRLIVQFFSIWILCLCNFHLISEPLCWVICEKLVGFCLMWSFMCAFIWLLLEWTAWLTWLSLISLSKSSRQIQFSWLNFAKNLIWANEFDYHILVGDESFWEL